MCSKNEVLLALLAMLVVSAMPGKAEDMKNTSAGQISLLGETYKMSGLLAHKCFGRAMQIHKDNLLLGIVQCLKRNSLIVLDRILDQDLIQLPYEIQLVRSIHANNETAVYRRNLYYGKEQIDWKAELIEKIGTLFKTHILKVRMNGRSQVVEGRRRHGRDQMMHLMVFGIMAMAIIAIPLGFQFLSVLGGKALLLAKLALILTSIQGLKRIAQSDVSYGLYRSPIHRNHQPKPWLYDRRWQFSDQQGYDGYEDSAQQSQPIDSIRPRISVLQENA